MFRRSVLVLGAFALTSALAAAATDATIVLNSGERHSGSLVYHQDNNIAVVENGQERSFPQSDVAVIQYTPGDPSQDELSKLPIASGFGDEFHRSAVVTKSGDVVVGKIYDWRGDQTILDQSSDPSSGRRVFNNSDIARLYVNPAAARTVFHYTGSGSTASTSSSASTATSGSGLQVAANKNWTDTGINVKKGDRISFHTSGQIEVTNGKSTNADGLPSMGGKYPLSDVGVGALIGRIGIRAVPFAIGSNSNPIVMPADGRLYLGVNDDVFTDNNGAFNVEISR